MQGASTDRNDFISYPTNRVVGTVADAGRAREAIDALLRAGFPREHIEILHGDEDLHRLDPTGAEHGFLAQFQRRLIRAFDLEQFRHLTHHVEDVRAGRFVIMVLTKRRDQRMLAAQVLHEHAAESVGFCGRWAWEEIPAAPQISPERLPELFARAWNNRDATALASLFDEDAEFVNVTGVCWHDRESIRTGSADRMVLAPSTLATAETKVKHLSADVVVVHARLLLSDGAPSDAVAERGARTTIVSFVVHRAGEGWRCASAHNTDLIQDQEPNVIG